MHRTWVTSHNRIGCEKQNAFDHRLGYKDPIKEILVNGRRGFNLNGVPDVAAKALLEAVFVAMPHRRR